LTIARRIPTLSRMFGRLNLMKDGANAEGLILQADIKSKLLSMSGNVDTTKYVIQVQVRFDDDSTSETEFDVPPSKWRDPLIVGQVLPLRYDPKDRTRVEIDFDAMKAAAAADRAYHAAKAREFALRSSPADLRAASWRACP
jgi:hypothetical protein